MTSEEKEQQQQQQVQQQDDETKRQEDEIKPSRNENDHNNDSQKRKNDTDDSEQAQKNTITDTDITLDTCFMYQNSVTGQVSSAPLTTKQLCRLLCPSSSTTTTTTTATTKHITLDTLLIQLIESNTTTTTTTTTQQQQQQQQYSPEGWKPARSFPILQEAAACQWYYVDCSSNDNTTTTETKGPVTCRTLSELLYGSTIITTYTQVYNSTTQQQQQGCWKPISELPYLQLAMEAFYDPNNPKYNNNNNNNNNNQKHVQIRNANHSNNNPDEETNHNNNTDTSEKDMVQDELNAFLSGIQEESSKTKKRKLQQEEEDDDDEEGYQSDGGTNYVKRLGAWIPQNLVVPTTKKQQQQPAPFNQCNNNKVPSTTTTTTTITKTDNSDDTQNNDNNIDPTITNNNNKKKKKKNRSKFAARNARCWIYITGLPSDCTIDEVADFFSKAGIYDLDPETQKPKIKLYYDKHQRGKCKGDASICYARPESVELAITLFDGAPFFRNNYHNNTNTTNSAEEFIVHVERAKFEQRGEEYCAENKQRISNVKRKVAKLATLQATDWDEGEINGRLTGGRKGLRIIVLKHVFQPSDDDNNDDDDDEWLAQLEQNLRNTCEAYGVVEKITVFSKNPQGVVIVKFSQPGAASQAVKELNGRKHPAPENKYLPPIEAIFWDGVTDYTVHKDEEVERKEMEERHEEFGEWLEKQTEELPEEFQLQTE